MLVCTPIEANEALANEALVIFIKDKWLQTVDIVRRGSSRPYSTPTKNPLIMMNSHIIRVVSTLYKSSSLFDTLKKSALICQVERLLFSST